MNKYAPKVNTSSITLGTDEYIPTRMAAKTSKYEYLFNALRPGLCLKVESTDTARVGESLREWLKAKGLKDKYIVRSAENYVKARTNPRGRVWLLDKPIKK